MSPKLVAAGVGMLGALLLGAGLAIVIPLSVVASSLIIAGALMVTIAATEAG